jgi:hypothetical protein
MHRPHAGLPTFPSIGATWLAHGSGAAATREVPSNRSVEGPHMARGALDQQAESTRAVEPMRRREGPDSVGQLESKGAIPGPEYGCGDRAELVHRSAAKPNSTASPVRAATRPCDTATKEQNLMSFKSREKKRRAKLAISKSRRDNKEKMAGRHYLTIVSRTCSCNGCGGRLQEGRECVYRHTPREILCLHCARARKLQPRPSERWEQWRVRQRRGRGRSQQLAARL